MQLSGNFLLTTEFATTIQLLPIELLGRNTTLHPIQQLLPMMQEPVFNLCAWKGVLLSISVPWLSVMIDTLWAIIVSFPISHRSAINHVNWYWMITPSPIIKAGLYPPERFVTINTTMIFYSNSFSNADILRIVWWDNLTYRWTHPFEFYLC